MNCKACGKPIDEHVAGRALDACVAEAVFGCDPMNGRHGLHKNGDIEYHWGYLVGHAVAGYYSDTISYAWEVVEKLLETEPFEVYVGRATWEAGWECTIENGAHLQLEIVASTPSLAICHAALKAVSNESM